ncbi:MAG: metallophosphoesterase family protein [Pseudomonadota bacterium]
MLLNNCLDFTQYSQLDVAIVSDTHGDIVTDVTDLVKQCDIVIHAGDIGNMAVLEQLQPKLKHVLAVAGNNDKLYLWQVKDWDIVRKLPRKLDISLSGGVISVEHGDAHDVNKPSHKSLRDAHQFSRAVIYGHTHHQVIDEVEPDLWVVNPGASGTTRTHGGASCLKLSISENDWKIEAYRFNE